MPLIATPSQYAQTSDLVLYALTPASAQRFGAEQQNAALQAASSLIDSYIGDQFVLPIVTWDVSLALATCNIAAYLLYNQYGFNPAAPVDQLVQRRYQEAVDWLSLVRTKQITPQWTDSSGTGVPSGDFVVSDDPVGFTDRGVTDSTANDLDWWC